MPERPRQHEEACSDTQRDTGDGAHHTGQFTGEWRLGLVAGAREGGDPGEPSAGTGRGHQRLGFTLHDERAGIEPVACADGDGAALAGQHGGVEHQPVSDQRIGVGGHSVARLQQHHVAWHDVDDVDPHRCEVAPHRDLVRQQLSQPVGRPVGAVLLCEREERVEHDHGGDRDRQLRQAGEPGEHGRRPQHHREEVDELVRESQEGRRVTGRRQAVRASRRAARRRLSRPEPGSFGRQGATHASDAPPVSQRRDEWRLTESGRMNVAAAARTRVRRQRQ